MDKIEEICHGVIYCVRLRLLERMQERDQGREPRRVGEANGELPKL